MKVPCTECQHVIEIQSVKPGRFKLKCAGCGAFFGLQVDAGPPIKVSRIRLAPSSPSKEPSSKTPAAETTVAATTNTKASVTERSLPPPNLAKRSESSATGMDVQATVDGPSNGSQTEATIDPALAIGSVKSASASVKVRSGGTKAAVAQTANTANQPLPEKLGGYRILKLLGQGAMGAVYQARQISLDRNVALKVIRGQWASSPTALVRFTREAYAAAQLTHHNVVQIYDFGEDHGQHFFSMEWIRGGPLSDLIKEQGALDPRVAAGYALQAARGLQYAHRNGMVHRDVKPANLLLNEEGVVKVADLGLVKVPDAPDPVSGVGSAEERSGLGSGSQVTSAGSTVGTPAYMSPEQTEDAAAVDHRADIYSLGCSLYHLLAGKPPFSSKVITEVMEQQRRSEAPSLQKLNARIPESLEQIVRRAMAKRLEDRYANFGEMIQDLEKFLGIQSGKPVSFSPQQADELEQAAKAYSASPLAGLRLPVLASSVLFMLLVTLILLFAAPSLAIAPACMFLAAIKSYLGWNAIKGKSPLAAAIRGALLASRWTDWFTWVCGLFLILLGLVFTGLITTAVIAGILGVVAGIGYAVLIDGALAKQRRPAIETMEKLLRNARLSGVDEVPLRQAIARFSGKHWEELFAELFGYAAVRPAREELIRSQEHQNKARFWPWRDLVIDRLQQRIDLFRKEREETALAKVEKAGLQAEGMSAAEAEQRAWQMAQAIIQAAKPVASHDTNQAVLDAAAKRARMKAMMAEARSGKYERRRSPLLGLLQFLLGGKPRFLFGCLLIAAFSLWVRQNGILDSTELKALPNASTADLNATMQSVTQRLLSGGNSVLGGWVNGIATLAAGLILLLSSLSGSARMSLFAYPAALVAFAGTRFGIPAVGPLGAELVAAAAGCALFIPGIFLGHARNE